MDMQEPMKVKDNSRLKKIANDMMQKEDRVWTKLNINSGSELYQNQDKQRDYFTLMRNSIDKFFGYYNFTKEEKKELEEILEEENRHSLNNYIGLKGLYEKKDQKAYIDFHTKMPYMFLNPSNVGPESSYKSNLDTITREEWNKKHKDYKLKTEDGKYYIMKYDDSKGTYLQEVNVMADGGEIKVGDKVGNTVQGFDFIVLKNDGKFLEVKNTNTGETIKTFSENMYKSNYADGGKIDELTYFNSTFKQWNDALLSAFPEEYKSFKLNDWHQWKQLDRLYFLGKTPKQAIDYFSNWKKLTNSIKNRMEYGGEIKVGDSIRLKKDLPYMASLSNLYDKDLKVDDITETYFASGVKKFYHITHDGDKYEVNEDFVDNERMEYGGDVNEAKILFTINDDKIDELLSSSNLNYEFRDDDGYLLSFKDFEKFKVMVSDKGYDDDKIFVSNYYYENGGFVEKTDEELKAMNDDELFAYLDAKAAYMKQYTRPLSAYKAKNFAATSKAIEYKNEGTSKLDENFVDIKKINEQASKDADDYLSSKMKKGGNTEKAFEVILKNPNGGTTERAVLLAKTKEDASKKALNLKEYKQYGYVVKTVEEYADGGELSSKDAKYTMSLAFDNAGFPKAFKQLKKVSKNTYLIQMSSYMKPNETLNNIIKEFNNVLNTNYIIQNDSYKKTVFGSEITIEDKTSMADGGELKIRDNYKYIGSEALFAPLRNGRNTTSLKKGDVVKVTRIGVDGKEDDVVVNFDGDAILVSKNKLKDSTKFEKSFGKGGETTFMDKVKAVEKNLLKNKKVPAIVQKDYGKTYDKKEARESAMRIIGSQTAKWKSRNKMEKGGKTSVSPLKDRIFGSKKNKPGSASTKTSAQKIELNETIIQALSDKAKEYNEKHSSKVSTSTLKAVMRRGMGAFSSSHRPGMTRQGWGYARVNKFLLKKGGKKVKAGYTQDDDLLQNGGELKKEMKVSDKPKFKKFIELEERAKASRNKTKNYSKWNETVGNNYRRRWYKMATELRGWPGEFLPMGVKSKPEWIKFIEEQGSVEDYNFGDVIA